MRDRRSGRRAGPRQIGDTFRAQRIDPHRPRDVLNGPLAEILEGVSQLVTDLLVHRPGNANPARFGQCLKACGDVDAVTKDVVAIRDDVAEVDPDTKPNAPLVGNLHFAVEHAALHLNGAAHRVDDARKLCKQPITGGLDDTAAMPLDLRVDQLPSMRLEIGRAHV